MIIDCHGHYTTAPADLQSYRDRQLARLVHPSLPSMRLGLSDDQIRESLEGNHIRLQAERGIDVILFSPMAAGMAHHCGPEATSIEWTRVCNDLIHRASELYPTQLAPVCQLPQSPGVSPGNCAQELERCVTELGFVGCNLNPDPTDGYWSDPPLTDRYWYPLYEKMVELDVPAMIHTSCSCNPNFHNIGAHYINGDTTAFMQFLSGNLFADFPTLRFVIPHGGGAVPYHWGRYRGLAQNLGKPPLEQHLLQNVYFDTCVYHQAGIDLLTRVIPSDNILFASEMIGGVRGMDPQTSRDYDETVPMVRSCGLPDGDLEKIFSGNALRVYPRLRARIMQSSVSSA